MIAGCFIFMMMSRTRLTIRLNVAAGIGFIKENNHGHARLRHSTIQEHVSRSNTSGAKEEGTD